MSGAGHPPAAARPATYTHDGREDQRSLTAATNDWTIVQQSRGERAQPTHNMPRRPVPFPRGGAVNAAGYDPESGLPGIVIKSVNGADFTSGVPAQLVFSAMCGDLDGFVLYVNGKAALANKAPDRHSRRHRRDQRPEHRRTLDASSAFRAIFSARPKHHRSRGFTEADAEAGLIWTSVSK